MSNHFAVNAPINNLSFGQVTIAILREIHKRGLSPSVFPIGPIDHSTQRSDDAFIKWMHGCVNASQQRYLRKQPVLRLWHISDSISSLAERGNDLLTFFELDQITPLELNVLKQQHKVYVTSRYTQSIFAQFGVQSEYVPLGFDAFNFSTLAARPHIDGVISYLAVGKLEHRKGHMQMLAAWAKRYGNRKEYRLNCSLHNPFLKPEDQNAIIAQALDGKQYWNINFLPWSSSNAEYNTVLQSSDIVLSTSGGEGRDLSCYHATALGAWPVALRAHAYLDYLNDENAILINPNGKRPAADNMFFRADSQINNGNLFSWSNDDLYAGCEEAERRVKSLGINRKGMELQALTYKDTVDVLLKGVMG